MTDIAHFPRPGQNYPYISFLSQGSTNISYTVWFSSHWTEQNSANLLKIEIVANAVLCHTYAWFSVAKFSTTHTVWHIVYNADSTPTSLHLVLALSTLLAGSLIGLLHPEPAPVLLLSDLMIGKETHCKNRWSHQLPLNWSRLQSISTSCQKMELWLMTHSKRAHLNEQILQIANHLNLLPLVPTWCKTNQCSSTLSRGRKLPDPLVTLATPIVWSHTRQMPAPRLSSPAASCPASVWF